MPLTRDMFTYQAWFTPLDSCEGVNPQLEANHPDMIWVIAANDAEAKQEAKHKVWVCFGVRITDIDIIKCWLRFPKAA